MVAFGTGTTLTVCSRYLDNDLQCCSPSDEDALGMTLSAEINTVPLGMQLDTLLSNATDLETALSCKFYIGITIICAKYFF